RAGAWLAGDPVDERKRARHGGRRQVTDESYVGAGRVLIVHQVVPEELAQDEPRRTRVEPADPRRPVEADHALPHVLPDGAEELGREHRRSDVAGAEG